MIRNASFGRSRNISGCRASAWSRRISTCVVKAIAALAAIDAAPFTLVFGGGTALARAHKIVRRMSEDVDFKIVPLPAAPVSRSGIRRALGKLGDQVTATLHAAGFAFDPNDKACTRSQNENRYTVWQLPYAADSGAGEGLRPTIQIEMTYAPLRQAVTLPVSSFVAEAHGRPPEVPQLSCVSVTETAAARIAHNDVDNCIDGFQLRHAKLRSEG